jgi:hypothetical protein
VYLIGNQEAAINTGSLVISGLLVILILRGLRKKRQGNREWLVSLLASARTEAMKASQARPRPRVSKKRLKAIRAIEKLESEI